ncbi:hypothetical protein L6R52_09120 [Myxococcota bacterium]|nr:hypothetical protein [Myxococcota bacterium]
MPSTNARLTLALALTAVACSPDAPEIAGVWRNGTGQLMVIEPDLTGVVWQEEACAPPLSFTMHRDPYDGYAIRFDDNQSIYFPLAQKDLFAPSEYFCSSKDSVAMCRFCRLDGDTLGCERTEQKITGRGGLVTHDCTWARATGTSTTSIDAGVTCPVPFDAGTGCRVALPPNPDAGVPEDARTDAGDPADAGVTD